MAAVPSIGRAARVEGAHAPEADLTRALYEQYANQIFRYCLHQLGSREEAEDAVQSTFLNAFRGIKRGVVPELESAWLFKIAHNVCLSRRRTSWRRGRIESPTDFDVVEELAPAPSRRSDELMGLQDVLEQMPENQRRAILLREWQGLSYREIADELELSQAAVETLIFRARRSLAAGLERPPETKRRIARGADIGGILAGLKSLLLGGGVAAKVAATVAVVSASTVVAAAPIQQHRPHSTPPPTKPKPAAPASGVPARSGPVTATAGPAAAPLRSTGTRAHAPRRHASAASVAARMTRSRTVANPATLEPASQTAAPVDAGTPASAPEPAAAPPAEAPRSEPQRAHAPAAGEKAKADKGGKSETKKNAKGKSHEGGKPGPVAPATPPSIQTTPDQSRSDVPGSKSSGDTRTIVPVPDPSEVTVSPPAPSSDPPKGSDDSGSGSGNGNDARKSSSATPPPSVITPPTATTLPTLDGAGSN